MFLKKLLPATFILVFLLIPASYAIAGTFVYEPMQPIPGSPQSSNFCEYVQAVYKFGIWTVGIAAMFMIMFGGYTYLLSAGNNATMGKAKGFIVDAIIGIVIAIFAYLILYVINPDLVEIRYLCDPAVTAPSSAPVTISPSALNGGLHPLTALPLAAGCEAYENEFESASGGNTQLKCLLIAIANQESGCNPNSRSDHGACGMMQILPTTAGMTCEELINDPAASIDRAAEFIAESRMILGGYVSFAIGSENAPGSETIQYGAFTYNTGNDDLIAAYNAGPGNNTSASGKMGPFQVSNDCPDPPTPAWQCDINPGGFAETQRYVMRVQDFQAQCLANQ